MARRIRAREVLRLRSVNGLSQNAIARTAHVSKHSVQDVLEAARERGVSWEDVEGMSEEAAYALLFPGRGDAGPVRADPDWARVHRELARTGVTLKLLHAEYADGCAEAGAPSMSYDRFCKRYRQYTVSRNVVSRVGHKAGRNMEVDWSGPTMRLVDPATGEVRKVYLFVACLPFSRYSYVEPTLDMKQDTWLLCHVHAFSFLGGATPCIVPDNLRTGVWIGYTDVDSSGRGAGDGRAVYEGPQAPEAFHRRVQEADSRPLQRRQAQARDHGRVRPRQEHRGEVDQVDKRDRLAARRGQPHARAEPDPGARAREPQAPDGGRRLKTSGADIRSKVRAIAANEGRYPISAQCRLLGVARSTYYSMRSRADRPAAPDPAAPAVVAAHAASKGRYGSRKIKASLERSGVTVSRRRVCRIMRENGLVSAYGRKRFKVHPGAVNEADVPNVVARGFGGRAPRTHICSDLTYVRVGASWNYVCLLVDLYNREIVGHSAGPRKDARLVKSAFATLSFPISDIEVFHTDRGSEFDNAEIDLMLEAFGIERSLSAKGCPYDNAVDESTNRILKAELVHRETFGTTRELRAKLSDYVHWYNNFRIHSTLGYMSPVEFREAGLSLPESSK